MAIIVSSLVGIGIASLGYKAYSDALFDLKKLAEHRKACRQNGVQP